MANKKKREMVSLPETEEFLHEAEWAEETVQEQDTIEEIVEKPIVKPRKNTKKEIKEEKDSKVVDIKTGKIVRIFDGNMAMVEINGIQSLISLVNSRRYKVGDVIQL